MRNGLFLLLLLMLYGCITPTEVPDEYIQETKMAQLMADLLTAQERLKIENLTKDSAHQVMYGYYRPKIFKRHGVSEALFDSSYHYYSLDPEVFDRVMSQCVDTLAARSELKKPYQE